MIKTLARSIRQYKTVSLLSVVCMLGESVLEIVIPLIMSNLLDFGVKAGDMAAVYRYGAFLLFFALMQLVTGVLGALFSARGAAGFAANLREDMYHNVQSFAFSNIDRFSTASIVTRLTTDVTNVQMAYQMLIRMAIRSPAMLIFAVVVCFRISHSISMIFLVVIPVLAVGLFAIIHFVHPLFRKVFRTYDELNNVVQEDLRGIRVVKSFDQENYEITKFHKISQKIYRTFTKAERTITLNSPLMMFCMYGTMLFLSWFGAQAVVASGNDLAAGLTTGQLTALFTYAMQILMSLMMLSMIFAMLTIAQSSAERIAELLQETGDIANPASPVTEVADGSISFQNVDFSYHAEADKKVLRNIALNIAPGQTVGILGGTGSAKTSLVQLIPRLYDATGGQVLVGGVDVRQYDLETLRQSVAMVLQKNELFSGTVKENLRWGNENATDEEIIQACKMACAHDFVSAMPDGYDTMVEQGGTNVSGGQKQRLCIARALLKQPKILILDDSTSAVDTKTDAEIQKAFAQYIPETTKIIIAQRVSSISHADQIVVLDDGMIVDTGTHEELLKTCAIYQEVYASQQKGAENS